MLVIRCLLFACLLVCGCCLSFELGGLLLFVMFVCRSLLPLVVRCLLCVVCFCCMVLHVVVVVVCCSVVRCLVSLLLFAV